MADGQIDQQAVRVIAVVQDTNNLFPRAKQGEVGLLEGWSLAKVVDDVIKPMHRLKLNALFYVWLMCQVSIWAS